MQLASDYTRVYDAPTRPLSRYAPPTAPPAAPAGVVYADVAVAGRNGGGAGPVVGTEYAILHFTGAGKEVQV